MNEEFRAKVVQMLARVSNQREESITDDQTLVEGLGMDSLMFISFIVELETELGVEIPPQDLHPETFETVGRTISYAQRLAAG